MLNLRTIELDEPEVVRELTTDDLKALTEVRGDQESVPLVERLRARHHSLARALARGLTNWEASHITGYSPSRVSILKGDPAFQELVRHYKKMIDAELVDLATVLADGAADAMHVLQDRLEINPESFSNGDLMQYARMNLDRAGFGPQTNTNTKVEINMGDRLKAARNRHDKFKRLRDESNIVDVTPKDA